MRHNHRRIAQYFFGILALEGLPNPIAPVGARQVKLAIQETDVCDICGKLIAGDKPRSSVTQHLFSESRCQCILPERAVYNPLKLAHPELRAQEKERAQEIKFVVPSMQENVAFKDRFVERVATVEKSPVDLEKIQAALPARYNVTGFFGQGGMGAVFRAFDQEENRPVAIKVIRPQLVNDATSIKRFEHEARAASGLIHPNIATIYDHGVGPGGTPYLVMELVEGQSLETLLLREGPLKNKRAVELCLQVAHALEAAHAKGIMHRDIKPSNIIVTNHDGNEIAKLADFGIAKSLLPLTDMSQSITQTGLMVGSPLYMSPEQCEGKKVDQRSDLYSLGCVLYKCLCGHTPFESENALSVLLQHIEEMPAPVCTRVQDHLSNDLNFIVMNCLDKSPSNRYSTAAQLAADLESRLVGRKIHAHTNLDYSPVHIPKSVKELSVSGYNLYSPVIFTKAGWKQSEKYRHTSRFVPLLVTFIITLVGGSLAGAIWTFANPGLKGASSWVSVDDGRISAAQIVANKKTLHDSIIELIANSQRALNNGDFKGATYRLNLLTQVFQQIGDVEQEANSWYYLAVCEEKLKHREKAIVACTKALKLFENAKISGALTLQDKALDELKKLSDTGQSKPKNSRRSGHKK